MGREKGTRSIRAEIRRYFVAGILVLLPLAITVWIAWQIVSVVEGGVQTLMHKLDWKYYPGCGFLLVIVIVFGAGLFATNVIGRRIATPLTDPSPGIAPMNNPRVTPTMISIRFTGWTASTKPPARRSRISMIFRPLFNR